MAEKTKDDIVDQLKLTLRSYIESNERVVLKFNRIMHWLFIIFITLSLATLCGIGVVIYIVSQPVSQTGIALKQVDDLNKSLVNQRKFIEMDRADITVARAQLIVILAREDSIKKAADSVLNDKYKKAMRGK